MPRRPPRDSISTISSADESAESMDSVVHSAAPSITNTRFVDPNSDSENDRSTTSISSSSNWNINPNHKCHWSNCHLQFATLKGLRTHVYSKHVIDSSSRAADNWNTNFATYLSGNDLVLCGGHSKLPNGCVALRLYKNSPGTVQMCIDCVAACKKANVPPVTPSKHLKKGRMTKNSNPNNSSVTTASSSSTNHSRTLPVVAATSQPQRQVTPNVVQPLLNPVLDPGRDPDDLVDRILNAIVPTDNVTVSHNSAINYSANNSQHSDSPSQYAFLFTVDDLITHRHSVTHSIPRNLLVPITDRLCVLLDQVSQNIPNSEFYYQLFCCVMFAIPADKTTSISQAIRDRLDLWNAKNYNEFYLSLPPQLPNDMPVISADSDSTQHAIRTLINGDECSKAFSRLNSTFGHGTVKVSPENFPKIQAKFVGANVDNLDDSLLTYSEKDGCISVPLDVMMMCLKKMKNSAGGPDGMTAAVLKQLCSVEKFRLSLLSFVNKCLSGTLSYEAGKILNSARLIGLWKDANETDLRPISLGNSLRRLVARCTLHYVLPLAESVFGPDQYGAGTPNSIDKPVHLLRNIMQAALDSSDDFIVMSRDAKNAFNEVDQNVIFNGVAEYMPKLSNYLRWVYGCNAPQLFGSVGKVFMRAGVFQGDPLSPILFCFIPRKIWSTIETMQEINGVDINWSKIQKSLYMDDTTIAGPPSQVFAIAEKIREVGAPLGFVIVPKKDKFARPNPDVAHDNSSLFLLSDFFSRENSLLPNVRLPSGCAVRVEVSPRDGIEETTYDFTMPTGLPFLGSFVSPLSTESHPLVDDTELVTFVDDLVVSTLNLQGRLQHVQAFQDRLILLRMCASSMTLLSHVARTIPPNILQSANVSRVDDFVEQLVVNMMQNDVTEDPVELQQLQAAHPFASSFFESSLQDGGLGLRRLSQYCSGAYIASVTATLSNTLLCCKNKFAGTVDLSLLTLQTTVVPELLAVPLSAFNNTVSHSTTAEFIKNNIKTGRQYRKSDFPLKPMTVAIILQDALSKEAKKFSQRILSRTVDLALRCKLLKSADDYIAVDKGYQLTRLQHIDNNSSLFVHAKPDYHADTLLSNDQVRFGLQFYTDTMSSFAFNGLTECAHTAKPLEHHSLVWCQKAGQNVQRHEDIVHSVAAAINNCNNNQVALANVNLAYSNPRASSSASAAVSQELKPADILVNNRLLIDVTVVDPRTKQAMAAKYYKTPDRIFKDAINNKQTKYQSVVRRDNRSLAVFVFSQYGKQHHYVMKTLKPLLKVNGRTVGLFSLRVKLSLIFFSRAANAIENHLRHPRQNVQPEVQQRQLELRERNRQVVYS